jgi:acyl-CoA thioester hydrolase
MSPSSFEGYSDVVRPEWIDYNGHFNAGYYLVCFDEAIEPWMDFIGLGPTHRHDHKVTTFSAQNNVTYVREVHEGTNLMVSTQLLGFDRKRIHAMQVMWNVDERFVSATCEVMSLHVSEESRRVSEMHDEPYGRLGVVWEEHRMIDIPPQVGQVMSVPGWMGDKNEKEGLK